MAAGDITTIKEFGRYSIPGGGVNQGGAPVNNKVMVWGTIEGTYDGTVGLNLDARGGFGALGLTNMDFFSFDVREAGVSGTRTNPTQQALFRVGRENENGGGSVGKLFVIDEVGAASPAEPSDNDLITLNFLVIGDDASAPVLT